MRAAQAARRFFARGIGPDRHAYRLRARHLRRLHNLLQRRGRTLLPDVRGAGRGRRADNGRGSRQRRRAPPDAAGFSRAPRVAMRLLHAGYADRRARLPEDQSRPERGRNSRRNLGGAVPLHRLREHRQGGQGRRGGDATRGGPAGSMSEGRAPHIGRSLLRREDRRLLTGRGQFIADLELPRMLHAAFVRSPVAHARIRAVDLSVAAAAAPGVALALSGAELARLLPPLPDTQLSLPSKWTSRVEHEFHNPQQPGLAHDKVRHVGEAVAVVVAESRYGAEDAAELVRLDLDPLPAVVSAEAALAPGAPLIHEHLQTNLFGAFSMGKGNVTAAMAGAPHKFQRRFYHHRYAAMPMECRGVAAIHDPRTDTITIWSATQVVHWVRREVAAILGMPEARVRCVALDVGGGFGLKGHVYPEDLVIPFLARRLGRPVRWLEDRHEHLSCSAHSRDQLHEVEVGFDDDGHILALRDNFIVDCGAWNPIGGGVPYNTAAHLTGPYKIDHLAVSARTAATNKVQNTAYRGAGRPEAVFAMERIIDLVAGNLGLEPGEVRRHNMISAEEMPYRPGILYRDGEEIVYDSGDYPGAR